MALGVPGRLRPRIITTFGTTRVVGRVPNSPAAFAPGEIPGTAFQRLSRSQGIWFCRKEPRKKSPVTQPGIDPGTIRLVAQRLNHYATPGPSTLCSGPEYFRHNYCIFFRNTKYVYQFTCTQQKASDNSEARGSFQNCASAVWNLVHVTVWRLEH